MLWNCPKILKYNTLENPFVITIKKKTWLQHHETPCQTAMKKTWLLQQNWHGCKKTKKTVSKHENLWHFFKIGNTFLKSHFFFANEKKKLIFGTKKTKIMQQFQLKFFKNTLVRSVFYISNETLHFFKISFTETVWN